MGDGEDETTGLLEFVFDEMRQEIGVKFGFTLVVLAPKKVGDLARYDGFKADLIPTTFN